MNRSRSLALSLVLARCCAAAAFGQTVPVAENLWRLLEQKDTDGNRRIIPYGWLSHQMLAWQGFRNYGLDADADRLAYRWLYTIAKNAHDYNGTIPEKYNVVTGSHEVFAEYGNVGTRFSYIAPEGFGWMNASYQVGMRFLSARSLETLRRLDTPPSDVPH